MDRGAQGPEPSPRVKDRLGRTHFTALLIGWSGKSKRLEGAWTQNWKRPKSKSATQVIKEERNRYLRERVSDQNEAPKTILTGALRAIPIFSGSHLKMAR